MEKFILDRETYFQLTDVARRIFRDQARPEPVGIIFLRAIMEIAAQQGKELPIQISQEDCHDWSK